MASSILMDPLLPEEGRRELEDLAIELVEKASGLAARIHPVVRRSVGDLVRSMNCYYSNLIEGHDTHPRDIDRALAEDYSQDAKKRVLQLEAKAHIEVQRMIDFGDVDLPVVSIEFISWVHREFGRRLPEELLWVEDPDTGRRIQVIPGKFRESWVQVGQHIPPAAEEIERFLTRFVEA